MTLSDAEIAIEINTNKLVTNVDMRQLAGACYELRMGNVYYDLTEEGKRFAVADGQCVLIKPGHRVVLITAEELNVPADILVRVVSKGSLFSIGLTPVATYADPGFGGNLGIVTQNISDKFIELPPGEPIAKADFTRLSKAANHPYKGQHGFQLGIWPIKFHLQKEYSQVARDSRVQPEIEEALALLPLATRTVIRRIERTQFWTMIAVFLTITLNTVFIFLVNGRVLDQFYGVVGNLIASGIIAFCTILANILRKNG